MPRVVKPEEGEVFDIELEEDILRVNRELAEKVRAELDSKGVFAIDVMGSVGSGKTSLIEAMAKRMSGRRVAVIAGDVETSIDAERLEAAGVSAIQVNTGRECHLDANLILKAIKELDLSEIDVLFIENVGNLICPADFPLGAHRRLVVISVTEGEHMVMKHPMTFANSDVVAINKADLAEAMGVSVSKLIDDVRRVNPRAAVVVTSAKTGMGVDELISALGIPP